MKNMYDSKQHRIEIKPFKNMWKPCDIQAYLALDSSNFLQVSIFFFLLFSKVYQKNFLFACV